MKYCALDFLRKELRTTTKDDGADNEDNEYESDGKELAFEANGANGGSSFFGNEGPADILNYLSDRVKQDDFSGERARRSNHSDGVNDWDGIEKRLRDNFPDRTDVTVFDIDGAEEEGYTKCKKI